MVCVDIYFDSNDSHSYGTVGNSWPKEIDWPNQTTYGFLGTTTTHANILGG